MLNYGLQVHLEGATAVVRTYWGNVGGQSDGEYSADPRVDKHHLISISSYHTMKIQTLSFPTFGLTCSVQDSMEPCSCMDPQRQVVSYLPTRFLPCFKQNRTFLRLPFGCHERSSGLLIAGSLPSSSIV